MDGRTGQHQQTQTPAQEEDGELHLVPISPTHPIHYNKTLQSNTHSLCSDVAVSSSVSQK